jgi:hypothetical protein
MPMNEQDFPSQSSAITGGAVSLGSSRRGLPQLAPYTVPDARLLTHLALELGDGTLNRDDLCESAQDLLKKWFPWYEPTEIPRETTTIEVKSIPNGNDPVSVSDRRLFVAAPVFQRLRRRLQARPRCVSSGF